MLASPAAAQQITPLHPGYASCSTTVDIDRTITTNIYGGDYKSWSGTNVTPGGDIQNSSTTYSVTTAGDQFQLETVDRTAGVVGCCHRRSYRTAIRNYLAVCLLQ